jgi:two-component SAPR family response regulator
MDELWRDRDPAAAANNLHQAVYVVRSALGSGAIELREEMLRLGAEVEVDVDRLEVAAADARRPRTDTAYDAALSLYSGELLPENRHDDSARALGARDRVRARTLLDESAARFSHARDDRGLAAVLVRRASLDLADDALPAARRALDDALEMRHAHGTGAGLASSASGSA